MKEEKNKSHNILRKNKNNLLSLSINIIIVTIIIKKEIE